MTKIIRVTKKDIDEERVEFESGIFVFFANGIKQLKEKVYAFATNRPIPFGTKQSTIDHVRMVTRQNANPKK